MAIDYTNIEEVVNDFQLMIDDTSYDKEAQVYQLRLLALQGLRELTFDVEQSVKTTTMVVDSTTLQVTIPADYVKVLRIGYKGDDGEFHSFGTNPNLSLDSSVSAQVNDDLYDENNPYFHTDIGKKFGVGGGVNSLGYYRINRSDNTINFSSGVAGKTVFMEYISDGITETPPKNHVVRFTLNSDIENNTTIKIPNRSGSFTTYTFKLQSVGTFTSHDGLTSNPASTDVYFSSGSTSSELAEVLSEVINNGHPRYSVAPSDSKIKASNNGDVLTVTLSNLTSAPLNLLSIGNDFDSNVEDVGTTNVFSVISQELVQLGSLGDKPRVHKFCEEALRSYVYYKYVQRKRGIPANEKQMAKRAYFNEKRLARARMMNFNKETAMLTSRKAFKQSPKI
tara:strand:- start:1067 stop:2248 length:1182 start_codon:yes stop_codon:yes gene_type:complete